MSTSHYREQIAVILNFEHSKSRCSNPGETMGHADADAILPIINTIVKDAISEVKAAAYAEGERAMQNRCAAIAETNASEPGGVINCQGDVQSFTAGMSESMHRIYRAIRALPVEAAPATPPDEIAWLAEALVPPRDGNPGTVHWVNMEHGALGFTTDSYKALRFSRKEDVEAIATLYGFQGQNLKPVVHMWSGGPGVPVEAAPATSVIETCLTCYGDGVIQSKPAGAGHADDLAEYLPCPHCSGKGQLPRSGGPGAPSEAGSK